MDVIEIVRVVLGVALVGVLAWLALQRERRGGERPTVSTLVDTFTAATTVAQTLVQAAEQLGRTGQIDLGKRKEYVQAHLSQMFPNLEPHRIDALIEGAVWAINEADDLLADVFTPGEG